MSDGGSGKVERGLVEFTEEGEVVLNGMGEGRVDERRRRCMNSERAIKKQQRGGWKAGGLLSVKRADKCREAERGGHRDVES
ncbi:hypothetical protein JOQ06_019537 [Pogonophryne albipinna]|uniref:Uncharacterized protein n=1 Tax=Pogonophryne albipinna TaxID=1090488 RepID=A0AAD6AE18_9TELE|nr:hypothetical protein JOQ06_019537 [Pogonophryne albipinna]